MDNMTPSKRHRIKLISEQRCVVCGIKHDGIHVRCDQCHQAHLDQGKTYRLSLINAKKCIRCTKPVIGNFKHCDQCLMQNREDLKKSADAKKELNLCVCGNKLSGTEKSCAECKEYRKEWRHKHRITVFNYYGNKCACCGESELYFLTIDHINGGGRKHKQQIKQGDIYKWLVNNGFPPGFQLLCFNCNSGRYRAGGVCPHKQPKLF